MTTEEAENKLATEFYEALARDKTAAPRTQAEWSGSLLRSKPLTMKFWPDSGFQKITMAELVIERLGPQKWRNRIVQD